MNSAFMRKGRGCRRRRDGGWCESVLHCRTSRTDLSRGSSIFYLLRARRVEATAGETSTMAAGHGAALWPEAGYASSVGYLSVATYLPAATDFLCSSSTAHCFPIVSKGRFVNGGACEFMAMRSEASPQLGPASRTAGRACVQGTLDR